MRTSTATLISGLAATLALAQNSSSSYYIVPDSVSISTRDSWCTSQTAACPLICLQTAGNSADTIANTCDPTTLTYSCVCSNNISPNASEYSQTLPYFICTEWGNQCVTNCSGDNTCAYDCRAYHPCGALDPKRYNTTTSSAAMSKTATTTGGGEATNSAGETVYSGFGGSAATSTSSSSSSSGAGRAAAAVEFGNAFGLGAVALGLFGGFALLL